jgi:hypothetical protein
VADTGIINGSGRESRAGWRIGSPFDASTGDAAVIGQTQPPLGRDPDGPAGRLDYAELCIACDNRTDELRLLGNGVVWQTAEKAFRVLADELWQQ